MNPPAAANRVDRVESIQWLRGIAAMLVVCNHCVLLVHKYGDLPGDAAHQLDRNLALAGAFGVDLFFVISGFVMAMSASRFSGRSGALNFLAQRYNRIAPLFYLLSTMLWLDMIRAQVPIGLRDIANTLTFIPWFDGREYHWPIHYLGWTLAFEFVFYAVVATFILTGWAARARALALFLLMAVAAGSALDMPWMPLRMLTSPLMAEFALGVLSYLGWRAGLFARVRALWTFVFLVALVMYVGPILSGDSIVETVATRQFEYQGAALRLLYWGIPAVAIIAWTLSRLPEDAGRLRGLANAVGDASYSIYLTHLFVLRLGEEIVQRLDAPAWLVATGAFILSPLVGWLCFRLVEQPMLPLGQRWLKRRVVLRPSSQQQGGNLR